MKLRLLFTFILTILVSTAAFAQPANRFIAPDFTLTDMNGKTHRLYDYLDNDVTVILDMWATWCGPCLGSIPGLEEIWETHGFSATGDSTVMILSLESDANTSNEASTVAQYGIATPVFNTGHTLSNLYPFSAYPTFFVVCPDRNWEMRVGGIGSDPTPLYNLGSDCMPLPHTANDVQTKLKWYEGEPNFCQGGSITPGFWVKNMGSQNLSSFNVEVKLNGNTIGNVPWSGNLIPYDGTFVSLNTFSNLRSTMNLDFVLTNPNAQTDDNSGDNALNIVAQLADQVPVQPLIVVINTDAYGDETSWKLEDDNGNIIGQGGQIGGYPSNQQTAIPITLPGVGCYSFKVFDSFGDGLEGNASVELRTNQGFVVAKVSGLFGSEAGSLFEGIDNTAIDESLFVNELTVFPNPFSGNARVNLDLVNADYVSMTLVDFNGKTVQAFDFGQKSAGRHELKISAEGVATGMYFLTVKVGEMQTVRKVTLK